MDNQIFLDMKKRAKSGCLERPFSFNRINYFDELDNSLLRGLSPAVEEFVLDQKFINRCPHRGGALQKKNDIYQCSYHGWKFCSKGNLLDSCGDPAPYKKESLFLEKLSDFELGGMIFNKLVKVLPYYGEINFLSEDSVYVDEAKFEVDANWKLQVEGLLETYHFKTAHSPYLAGFEGSFSSVAERNGSDQRILIPMNDFDEHEEMDNISGLNIMYFVFPATFYLFMNGSYVCFSIDSAGGDKSVMRAYSFATSEENIELAKKSFEFLKTILPQDFKIQEHQQKMSGFSKVQRYTPYEIGIKYFYESLESISEKA